MSVLWSLSDLCTPWCVHVAVTLRVAEHIAAGRGRIDSLASACSAHEESLHRVLRHLVARGVFEEPDPGRFVLNEPARMLLEPPARLGLDLHGIGGRMAYAWGGLLEAVRTGTPGYASIFGQPFWDDLASHPDIATSFDALMGPGHGVPDPNVLLANDWSALTSVVDVGGGTGALLAEILRVYPHLRGILVDLPETVARSADVFRSAAVADRATTIGQSFFDALPPGGDVYLLKSVMADWPDAEAAAILRRCADAARPGGRVVVVNGVTPDDHANPALLMMVLVGGKERTLAQFTALARGAGLRVTAAAPQSSWRFIVECVPT